MPSIYEVLMYLFYIYIFPFFSLFHSFPPYRDSFVRYVAAFWICIELVLHAYSIWHFNSQRLFERLQLQPLVVVYQFEHRQKIALNIFPKPNLLPGSAEHVDWVGAGLPAQLHAACAPLPLHLVPHLLLHRRLHEPSPPGKLNLQLNQTLR